MADTIQYRTLSIKNGVDSEIRQILTPGDKIKYVLTNYQHWSNDDHVRVTVEVVGKRTGLSEQEEVDRIVGFTHGHAKQAIQDAVQSASTVLLKENENGIRSNGGE